MDSSTTRTSAAHWASSARSPPSGCWRALRFAPGAPPIGAAKRLRGLTLAATDLPWTTGKGPAVEGPGEALLMAMAGRPAALPELFGPGLATLAARIEAGPG